MHPSATLFLDVCVQPDLWPDGVWPLVRNEEARNVARLFAIAGELELRQGGVVCRHLPAGSESVTGAPPHCRSVQSGHDRPAGCTPNFPMQVWTEDAEEHCKMRFDRVHAVYVDSGCGRSPDGSPRYASAFEHLTAGIRDVIVFGAGVEHGLDRVVAALLRRRIRTHVALDAVGAADEVLAQGVVARWKRRSVDGATVDTIHRLLIGR